MKSSTVRADLLLLLTSVIWGTAFVAQRVGMESMEPMLFNAVRFLLGALVILPLAVRKSRPPRPGERRRWLVGGLAAGVVLTVAAALQQRGLVDTSAGKAGFITGLYVVLVPMLGLCIGHRAGKGTWFGVALAIVGLYLLSVTEDFTIEFGDAVVLAGALFWALHVLLVGMLAARVHAIRLALLQFLVCSLLSFCAALATETVSVGIVVDGLVPVLYGGVLSVGVGYTLQVVAQKEAVASHAAIILSLEVVFAALAGWLLLDEILGMRAIVGCSLMLAGMLVSQLGPLLGRLAREKGVP